MNKFAKDFTFELEEPIVYQAASNSEEIKTLVLSAPSNAQSRDIAQMREMIIQAFMEQGKNAPASTETQQKAEDMKIEDLARILLMALYSISGASEKATIIFRKLITGKGCMLAGKYESTEHLLNKIQYDEFELMMGEYTANFILPSWMRATLMNETN